MVNIWKFIKRTDAIAGLFALLGPIGNLLPLVPNVPSFRAYYILLPFLVFYMLLFRLTETAIIRIAILTPGFLYMLLSMIIAGNKAGDPEDNAVFRYGLLAMLCVFTMLAGSYNENQSMFQKLHYIKLYLIGYLISLICGYAFFALYYSGHATAGQLERFHVLLQFGYGILRFSPGSYPNEYGTVSSFALSLLTLLFLSRKEPFARGYFRKTGYKVLFAAFFVLTFGALLLATTRAAYISYLFAVLYIFFTKYKRNFYKQAAFLLSLVAVVAVLLIIINHSFFDIFLVFKNGFSSMVKGEGSFEARIISWQAAYHDFSQSPIVGTGFGSAAMIHNTYLQMLFELGVAGIILIAVSLAVFAIYQFKTGHSRVSVVSLPEGDFLWKAADMALIHILWFALSNHNLNHHLTWFGFFLVLIRGKNAFSIEHCIDRLLAGSGASIRSILKRNKQ